MDDRREEGGRGQDGVGRSKFTSWITGAAPEDVAYAAKTALAQVAKLPQEHRDAFIKEVSYDPTVLTFLEEIKTPA